MKKQIILILFLIIGKSYAIDNAQVILNKAEKLITIVLSANPTTGYVWSLQEYDNKLIKLKSSKYIPNKTSRLGAGGIRQFQFKLMQVHKLPDKTIVSFKYSRPWEKDSGKINNITVHLKEHKNTLGTVHE